MRAWTVSCPGSSRTCAAKIDFKQSPKDLLRNAVLAFLTYIDANRASWMVLYNQATSSQAFAHTVREGRERIIDLVGRLLQSGTRNPGPETDFDMMAVALVGAGEAVATRVSTGDADVDEAAELMINLFWRGLKGKRRTRASEPTRGDRTAAVASNSAAFEVYERVHWNPSGADRPSSRGAA